MNTSYGLGSSRSVSISRKTDEKRDTYSLYKYFLAALLICLFALPVGAATRGSQDTAGDKPAIQSVVEAVDELYRHDSSRTLMEMTIETPYWERTLKIESWSEGMDKVLFRILEPSKERGMGTLRIDNEMWNYLPKTNKVMKIPPSMMMSSWMGSDFKNNDLVKEFTFIDDYRFSYMNESDISDIDKSLSEAAAELGEKAKSAELLYVQCIPKPGKPIIWGHVVLIIDADDLIPRMELYYDEQGELMRTMRFSDVTNFGGTRLPAVMELQPETKEGHRTVIRYLEAEFNISLERNTFSLRNLRTFRR